MCGYMSLSSSSATSAANSNTDVTDIAWREAFWVWLRIGLLSFGGPAAQIALMHREVVDERRWLSEPQFLNALSFCMLLPGPEAMQLATYTGWRLHGIWGGFIAGGLFVLPGAVLMAVLAAIYSAFGDITTVDAFFTGIQATVVVIVIQALIRVAGKSLQQRRHWFIAVIAFVSIFFLSVPFPLIVIVAAIIGAMALADHSLSVDTQPQGLPSLMRTLITIVMGLALWWLPILAIDSVTEHSILTDIATFFSTLAVVTFGGAYAVLAYMAQDVAALKGWLTTAEMMAGLGLAETTPGPLILVTEFVGFLAAYREGGLALGIAGAAVTLWVTFVPCFLWIFVGGPYIEWISAQPRLRSALSAITAAVVGVMLSLSIWFALHVFFGQVDAVTIGEGAAGGILNGVVPLTLWQPQWASLHLPVVGLVIISAYLLLHRQWNVVAVLGAASLLSILMTLGQQVLFS